MYLCFYFFFFLDENRDINGHPDEDLKKRRTQYNGDQLYTNVSLLHKRNILLKNLDLLKFTYNSYKA